MEFDTFMEGITWFSSRKRKKLDLEIFTSPFLVSLHPQSYKHCPQQKKKGVSRNSGVKVYYFIQMYLLYRYLLLKNNM